jgi:membrane protease YdiL (CAAX protease family)
VSRGRLIGWLCIVGAMTAAGYAARAAGGEPDRDVLYKGSTAAAQAVIYLIILAIVLAIAGGDRSFLGLRRPASWGRSIALAIGVLVAIYVVGTVIDQYLDPGKEQGLTPIRWEPEHAGAYAANFFVIAVMAPVVEELTYRGLGYGVLAKYGTALAIVGTALAFGLSHGLLEGLPVLVAFGIGLAYLRSRTDSVYPGMLVHGTFNAIALVLAVTT